MKNRQPTVYIGIVTYNSAAHMSTCVRALFTQTYKPLHIIVFDNNSTDNIKKIIQRYKKFVSFRQSHKNLGFGSGHNAILKAITLKDSDYYMVLNPDAELMPDCIETLVRSCQKHNAQWATGKLYKDIHTKTLYSVGHALLRDGYAFNVGYGLTDRGQYELSRRVFGAPGAAALYSGLMIRKISINTNFFDPTLFMYYEDVDIDWRAQLKGFTCVYEPTAIVKHPGGQFPIHLEAEVLSNRFLSIIKNAFLIDLLLYNFLIMTAHVLTRLLITPRTGLLMAGRLLHYAPGAWANRSRPNISRGEMLQRFKQAIQEKTTQPITLQTRLHVFVRRKFYK